jgi:hypothetical protein
MKWHVMIDDDCIHIYNSSFSFHFDIDIDIDIDRFNEELDVPK